MLYIKTESKIFFQYISKCEEINNFTAWLKILEAISQQ